MVDALSARIEMELGELDEEEAAVFRDDLGLRGLQPGARHPALATSCWASSASSPPGHDETRAWTIPAGSTAVDAAGAIHSDLARGFIRAEVVFWEDLLALGSTAEARKHASCARRARPTWCATGT